MSVAAPGRFDRSDGDLPHLHHRLESDSALGEVADHLHGSLVSAGASCLEAAGRRGIHAWDVEACPCTIRGARGLAHLRQVGGGEDSEKD